MAGGVYLWSQTQATNASADPTVNWAEGQAPSSINDSARNMMASVAKWRDDIAGAIATGGTSTAYTVTSNQAFDTLAHMSGQLIAFTPHTTNGGTTTLNVDSLGAKPVRSAPNVEIPAGTLVQGTPYLVLYNNSDAVFYLHGFFGNPYNIPLAGSLNYWGTTAPNSSFVFPFGQAISRTTYSALFALMGTTFGTGDGTTTFNLPDLRGRTTACLDNMGGTTANRLAPDGALASVRHTLGGAGGESGHTLTAAELPSITSTNASQSISTSPPFGQSVAAIASGNVINSIQVVNAGGGSNWVPYAGTNGWGAQNTFSANNTISVTSTGTSGNSHNNIQPTILCNQILRVI